MNITKILKAYSKYDSEPWAKDITALKYFLFVNLDPDLNEEGYRMVQRALLNLYRGTIIEKFSFMPVDDNENLKALEIEYRNNK